MSLQPPAATSLPNRSKTPAPKNRPIDLPMAQADANDDLTTIPSHLTVEAFLKSTSSAKPRTRKQITYKRKRSKTRQNTLQGGLIPEIADSFDDDDVPLSELAKHTRKQQKPQSARPRTRRRISGTHASRRGSSSRVGLLGAGARCRGRKIADALPITPPLHLEPLWKHVDTEKSQLKDGRWKDMNNRRNSMVPIVFSAKPVLTIESGLQLPITQWRKYDHVLGIEKMRVKAQPCQQPRPRSTTLAIRRSSPEPHNQTQPLLFVSLAQHEGELQNMRQLTKTGPQSVDYHESPQSASLEAKGGTLKKGAHRDPMLSSLQALDFEDVDTSVDQRPGIR
ncbi:hypothetical protein FRB96_005605 [Tulasnella sp. 330]|nr:hypothetical protein FRB96_005605 [Tulasnella sp. 330]